MDPMITAGEEHPEASSPPPRPLDDERDGERRFQIHSVTWAQYQAFRDLFEDRPGLRVSYLEGTLEIMSPSSKHEMIKTLLARLIETWATEREIDLRGHGSTTFKRAAKERGAEPDECYCLGRSIEDGALEPPDIAIEVVLSPPGLDKLAIYAGLGTPEVWLYRRDAIELFALDGERYLPIERSRFVPDLDVAGVAAYVSAHWKTQGVRTFVAELRRQRGG